MLFIDAHVHIHDCFNLDELFEATLLNFHAAATLHGINSQPFSAILLLAEGKTSNWFHNQMRQNGQAHTNNPRAAQWGLTPAEDGLSLIARHKDSSSGPIHIVAGRQIITAERLEVLALLCNPDIRDGLSLDATIGAIHQHNGLPVLPWGVGKWIGKRGSLLRDFLLRPHRERLFLGDNGGRPLFWPTPALFPLAAKKGIAVLPGTDPLPFPNEAARVGSFGFFLKTTVFDDTSPAASLKKILLMGQEIIHPFGRLQKSSRFMYNQLRLRLKF